MGLTPGPTPTRGYSHVMRWPAPAMWPPSEPNTEIMEIIAWCRAQFGSEGGHIRWSYRAWIHKDMDLTDTQRLRVWFDRVEDHTLFTLTWGGHG